ncbi:MAG: phosphotransferase [Pseudomonadales bacterium]|nr:phosphotransferase [Pseudomonadales bacterium]
MSEALIQNWVLQQLKCASLDELQWQALSGDASFRRYFRCQTKGARYIVALAPPATEKNHEFVRISKLLNDAGIKASEVLAVDYDQGFILQKDLGHELLADRLTAATADVLYTQAMQQLLQMQQIPSAALTAIPAYDIPALQLECSYFSDWFVEKMLGYHLSEVEKPMLQAFFDELCTSAENQPQGFVHRDYHCRNLMLTTDNDLATIDFQDALVGPMTYDLVSLLRDCYVVWPDEKLQHWLKQFFTLLEKEGLVEKGFDFQALKQAFDLMGLQRHIKVLGIFARLSLRDNKHGYLDDLPTVVNYVKIIAAKKSVDSPACQAFSSWFEATLMPLISSQNWWTPALIEKNIMDVSR